jgi:hypothetical protein
VDVSATNTDRCQSAGNHTHQLLFQRAHNPRGAA